MSPLKLSQVQASAHNQLELFNNIKARNFNWLLVAMAKA
jgi:hypothetical protein